MTALPKDDPEDELPLDLDDRLAALKAIKAGYEQQAIDANIAELTKLIAERDKVAEAYEAAYDGLAQRQKILEDFKKTAEPDFAELLPGDETAKVDKIVADRLQAIDDAHAELDARSAATEAAAEALAAAQSAFARATGRLDQIRTLPKSADARLKALEKLRDEIDQKFAAGDNATAYWLLTGKELVDGKGHVVLSGAKLFSGLLEVCAVDPHAPDAASGENLTSCPGIFPKAEIGARIEAAFADVQARRQTVDTATAALAAAQAEKKAAEAALAELKKNLDATIRTWLAAYPDAPDGAAE